MGKYILQNYLLSLYIIPICDSQCVYHIIHDRLKDGKPNYFVKYLPIENFILK